MMENESLREPKNTTVVFLSLLLAVAVIVSIVMTVKASSRGKECERLKADKEAIQQESDAIKQEAQIKMNEAEKLRQVAMEWTRQHQLRVQEEMRKKAEEAAKQVKAKETASAKAAAPVKKTPTVKKGSSKKSGTKAVKKSHS